MSWAFKRKLLYLGIVTIVILFFGYLMIRPYFNVAPTCFDGKQNGTETGTDCGGSCLLACTFQTDKISVLWARSFQVVKGRYNAVAYLENHNKNTAIYRISYRFRFADKDNLYIGKREGETYVPPSGKFAVFEPAIDFGNSIPIFTTFEFTQTPVWVQVSQQKMDQLKINVSDIKLENQDTSPRLSASVANNSLFEIPEVNIIAILYNVAGDAVSISRTYFDQLEGQESKIATFTWPEPIKDKIINKEIIPMYNIFSVKLR
jgi:hypothetical protein